MRIAHVVHSYFPRVGGIERAVQYLAEEQVKLGNDVMVVTSNIGVISPRKEIIGRVNVIRLKSRKLLYNDLTLPIEEPSIKDIDIIHAHSQNSLFSIIVSRKLKIKTDGKVVFHFMAIDTFKDHPNILIRLIAPYYGKRNTSNALKIADLLLVRSIRDLEILKKRYGVEAEYLPDAVPDYYFTAEKSDPDKFREKFGIKQEKFFLFIGRMHKLKGPQILVRALKYVNEDIAAVFIGPDGGYLVKTLDLAEKIGVKSRVYYLGYVDEKTKIEALDSATALVLPSLADHVEVYSIVVSEAWARGKPVIASRVGEIPYRIRQYVNGVLVNPSDPKALAEVMLKVAHDDELAGEMEKNGRKYVFSWREVAVKSLQLYRRVVEDR
jgi:glycosyltransferase involved in cell wall biosynthesis